MGLGAHPPKDRWSTQQHRVSKEIHEFFKQQHPQSTGRVLACTIMYQMRPQFPLPPPQASEADSCFMGRPFTHSRPGSPPRDQETRRLLPASPTELGTASVSPIQFLPHQRSEAAWASWLLTKASRLTRQPAKQASGACTAFPAQTQHLEGERGQWGSSLKYLLQYLSLSFRMKN